MPFVLIGVPAVDIPSWMKDKVQETCKRIWESMGVVSSEDLKDTDVGGVVLRVNNSESILSVNFIYNDRGKEFDNVLYSRLLNAITATLSVNLQNPKVLQSRHVELETTRTESDQWFEDPIWTTKVEKCIKWHANEDSIHEKCGYPIKNNKCIHCDMGFRW